MLRIFFMAFSRRGRAGGRGCECVGGLWAGNSVAGAFVFFLNWVTLATG